MGNLGGLLVLSGQHRPVSTPISNRAHPVPLRFGGCAAAWWFHGFLLGNSHSATVSVSAPRTVTGITRLSVEPGVREAR